MNSTNMCSAHDVKTKDLIVSVSDADLSERYGHLLPCMVMSVEKWSPMPEITIIKLDCMSADGDTCTLDLGVSRVITRIPSQ
jgi:hypothetical protein